MRARSTGGYDWTDPDYTPDSEARDEFIGLYFRMDDEVTRGMVNDYLDRIAAHEVERATGRLIVAFRRWHIDRHGTAPTVHDFRLMLDMAASLTEAASEA